MKTEPVIRISKQEFEAFLPQRYEPGLLYVEECGWFKSVDGKFIASIEKAISCDDWSYSLYQVSGQGVAEYHSYGCDRSSEPRIVALLVSTVRKLYRTEKNEN
jgi:hypothetical protein